MEITNRDIQLSRLLGPRFVTEASLGRVYQHFLKSGQKSWGIISAFKYGLTSEENKRRDKRLRSWLHDRGFGQPGKGYFQVIGNWTEIDPTTGEPLLDPETGEKKQAHELAYFIIGISQEMAMEAMHEFEQQAVLYAGPETDGKVSVITSGGSSEVMNKFSPGVAGDAYAQVRGKPFRFESIELSLAPSGHIEAMTFFQTKRAMDEGAIAPETLSELDLKLKMLKWE